MFFKTKKQTLNTYLKITCFYTRFNKIKIIRQKIVDT